LPLEVQGAAVKGDGGRAQGVRRGRSGRPVRWSRRGGSWRVGRADAKRGGEGEEYIEPVLGIDAGDGLRERGLLERFLWFGPGPALCDAVTAVHPGTATSANRDESIQREAADSVPPPCEWSSAVRWNGRLFCQRLNCNKTLMSGHKKSRILYPTDSVATTCPVEARR
jgi:hypothetical protein